MTPSEYSESKEISESPHLIGAAFALVKPLPGCRQGGQMRALKVSGVYRLPTPTSGVRGDDLQSCLRWVAELSLHLVSAANIGRNQLHQNCAVSWHVHHHHEPDQAPGALMPRAFVNPKTGSHFFNPARYRRGEENLLR